MAIIIRGYVSSDRDKICDLLSENTEYKRDRRFRICIDKVLENEESIVTVALEGEKIL